MSRSWRSRVLTTSRVGRVMRRSSTRLLRSWNDRRCTSSMALPAAVEEPVLGLLDGLVERLDGPEVPVDQVVQQPVEQERDAVLGQVRGRVPAGDDRIDVEGGVLADRDEGVVGDEHGDLWVTSSPVVLVEGRPSRPT